MVLAAPLLSRKASVGVLLAKQAPGGVVVYEVAPLPGDLGSAGEGGRVVDTLENLYRTLEGLASGF